jgi:hypothetical protein
MPLLSCHGAFQKRKGVAVGFRGSPMVINIVARSDISHRRHIYDDLKAYSCTFEHCDNGPFGSRTAWAAHERRYHLRLWRCHICTERFDSHDHVISHVATEHPSVDTAITRHMPSPPRSSVCRYRSVLSAMIITCRRVLRHHMPLPHCRVLLSMIEPCVIHRYH